MWELVWELEMVSLVSGNLEIQKTVFLGGSLGLLKHEFGGFLSDFADSYLSFLDLSSFHPSNAWDFEDQVFERVKTR
ncbi:unnamed protein product [Rhizophagus irregularis]|uniref:Uncharacterized protein n=1 Tax=Rhizophagus irregularis TaxID=588596 RepID=A0A915YVE6_9GLOM|nr:unnamed protein product [Rhizophagus irregularis]CAB5195360.1 unnamed protein product [Rhizophagus irregularis]CAB5343136.1 unnamed protein product [Rhizophagus irregularis]